MKYPITTADEALNRINKLREFQKLATRSLDYDTQIIKDEYGCDSITISIPKIEQKYCSVAGCREKHHAHTYCYNHYVRSIRNNGDVVTKSERLQEQIKSGFRKCNKRRK